MSNLDTTRKINLLKKILTNSKGIEKLNSGDSVFINWRDDIERQLTSIFGINSVPIQQFKSKSFNYKGSMISGIDYSEYHKKAFKRSFDSTILTIRGYVEELEEQQIIESQQSNTADTTNTTQKIFISHSSKDKNVVEEIIEILETIGVESNRIFCSSFEGYGIEYGENFLERLKEELDANVLVIFILSENFYKSPICLCEMGATWIKTNIHIPIIIPPFEFKMVEGVIPLTHGFKPTNKLALNQFKIQVENLFTIQNKIDSSVWERKRNRIVSRIEKNIT